MGIFDSNPAFANPFALMGLGIMPTAAAAAPSAGMPLGNAMAYQAPAGASFPSSAPSPHAAAAARSLGPAMQPAMPPTQGLAAPTRPTSAQDGGFLIGGAFGDWLRANPESISALSSAVSNMNNRQGFNQALAAFPSAQARDRQNARLKAWLSGLPADERALAEVAPQAAAQSALSAMFAKPDSTTAMKEYDLARQQGYGGSFLDFTLMRAKAGATSVNVGSDGKIGTVPPGWAVYQGPDGKYTMEPIANGPAAADLEKAGGAADAARLNSANQASTLLGTISSIRDVAKGAPDWALTGTFSVPTGAISATPAGKIRSYTKALQSGVALDAMLRLKQASSTGATGFGALNRKELDLLISQIGALDPDSTDWTIFNQTLGDIEARTKRVVDAIKRDMTPEEIRKLGLEPLLQMGDTQPPAASGPVDYREYFR